MWYYQRIIQGERSLRMFLIKFPTQSKFSYEIRSSYSELIQSSPEKSRRTESTPPLWYPHSVSFGAAVGLGMFGVVVVFFTCLVFLWFALFFPFHLLPIVSHPSPTDYCEEPFTWETLKNLNACIYAHLIIQLKYCDVLNSSLSLILVQWPKLYIWWADLTKG